MRINPNKRSLEIKTKQLRHLVGEVDDVHKETNIFAIFEILIFALAT